MTEERNNYQITRKDAKNCFVESLNDAFEIGKIHLAFATYDLRRPAGQRQTNNVQIYIDVDEFLELCRKVECGEFKHLMYNKKVDCPEKPLIYRHIRRISKSIYYQFTTFAERALICP